MRPGRQDQPESPSHGDDLSATSGRAARLAGEKGPPGCGAGPAVVSSWIEPRRMLTRPRPPDRRDRRNPPAASASSPDPGPESLPCTSATQPLLAAAGADGRLVEGADGIPVVRLRRRVAGLALRHDGPAALQPGPGLGGPQPAAHRSPATRRSRPDRSVRRLCDVDLHDRLGDGRDLLRHPRRQDRPREDDDADHPELFGLHGPECPLDGGLGLRASTAS